MMTLKWNGDAAMDGLLEEAARRLLTAAVILQTEHRQRLNVSNPRPYLNSSVAGEYARARTGHLRDGTSYDPTSVAEVKQTLRIRLGYTANARYGAFLIMQGRKSILDTAMDIQGQLVAVMGQGGAIEKA